MIDRLIAGLGEAATAVTAETIAEALWLAQYLPSSAVSAGAEPPTPPGAADGDAAAARPKPPRRTWRPGPTARSPGSGTTDRSAAAAEMYLATGLETPRASGLLATGSPAVAALPHALALARALRPLRRAVQTYRELEFDELATVHLTAETRTLQPAFSPVKDRWLDLALVFDQSPSMVVWESTIAEMVALAGRLNAFRDVRVWRMRPDTDGRTPVLSGGATDARRDPRELLDPRGRRLILMFSDCISAIWESTEIRRWLDLWGRREPVAIVQPLPQRLWHRCRPRLHPVALHPRTPGAPNSRFRPVARDEDDEIPPNALAVPVLELTPPWLAAGAKLIAGRTTDPINAVVMLTVEPREETDPDAADELEPEPLATDLPMTDQIRRFRAAASPNARHLAEFLAAAPLTLPVMRLVQRLMLPGSLPQDLAEVFLSGLLHRVTPEDRRLPADRVLYDFQKSVRQALLPGLRAGEALAILDEVSRFVNERMGTSFDFPALLAGQSSGVPAADLGQPFAAVARDVLQALGGRYTELAESLLPFSDVPSENGTDLEYDRPPGRPALRDKGEDVTQQPDHQGDNSQGTAIRPAIWGDVPPRNPDFTGRETLLRNLRRQLTNRVTALLPHALHGLGGVGKTQLAVEYAYRYESSYDLVWWVPAEQPALYRQSLTTLARRLNLIQPGEMDVAQALSSVHDALRTGRPYARWLLIFDNANRPEDLAPFLSNPGGHLLITSRNYNWAGIAQTVEVDVFSRPESIALLKRRLVDISDDDADRLSHRLGDLPLALEQAATWIQATATPVEEYTSLLDKRAGRLLQEGAPSTYETPVADAWGLAFEQLAQQTPAAIQLLELCAFFGAEPISVRLLPMGRYAQNLPDTLDGTVRDDIRLRRAVRDIARFGLAKVDAARNSIQVHRLVQAVLRDRLSPEQQNTYRLSVQEILAAYNPGDPTDDPQSWDRHSEIGPHVEPSGAVASDSPDIRKVVLDQIRYLYVSGDYASSRELGEVAYQVWLDKLGADDEQTIVTARFLANTLRSTGEADQASALNEQTLVIARRALGEDHEHTLAIANSVGADLRLSGDWQGSRVLDEDLLERHRRVFGDDDPNTLRVANNLGVDLRLLGDFRRARELDEDTWNRRRRVLGDDHPDTLFGVATGLSRDLYGLGRYQEAVTLQRQWLPVLRARLGPNHSNVLLASRIHAASLRKAGLAHEALDLAREVVRRREQTYGEEHMETMSAQLTLFTVLSRTDRLTEARILGEETLSVHRRTVGDDHPFTFVCMTDLAIVLRMVGDYKRAQQLDEVAVTGLTGSRMLGPDHPYAICAITNMSNNMVLSRNHQAAAALLTENLQRARRVQGEDHPETLACAANLALNMHASGDVAAARALREDTLARFQRSLDVNHPDIDDMIHGRSLYCVVDPPPT
jgi:hypothetical protein